MKIGAIGSGFSAANEANERAGGVRVISSHAVAIKVGGKAKGRAVSKATIERIFRGPRAIANPAGSPKNRLKTLHNAESVIELKNSERCRGRSGSASSNCAGCESAEVRAVAQSEANGSHKNATMSAVNKKENRNRIRKSGN